VIVPSSAVDLFTFVLTDIDSKFRFGFCRLSAGTESCLCIVRWECSHFSDSRAICCSGNIKSPLCH